MLVENVKVQLVRPPVAVRGAAAGDLLAGFACDRALAFVTHNASSFWCMNLFTVARRVWLFSPESSRPEDELEPGISLFKKANWLETFYFYHSLKFCQYL